MSAASLETAPPAPPRPAAAWLLDRAPFLVACAMLLAIVLVYGSLQTGVFTLDELNLDTAAAMTLMLAATGQTIVLIRGGIDLSIGGMISLGSVIAATRFGDRSGQRSCSGRWLILALGFGVGALNGALISLLQAPAVPRHARHLVDPERPRHADPADRRRQLPRLVDRLRLPRPSSASPRPVWLLDRARPVLDLVPRHPPRHRHPGHRLQRALGLPLRRLDRPHQHRHLRPLRPLRRRGRRST